MATLTYRADVGPHFRRAMMFRRKRFKRWHALHRDKYNRYDVTDNSRAAKIGQFFKLLLEVAGIVCFVAVWEILSLFKTVRQRRPSATGTPQAR